MRLQLNKLVEVAVLNTPEPEGPGQIQVELVFRPETLTRAAP